MSLNYDLRSVTNKDFLWRQGVESWGEDPNEQYMSNKAQSIIFATMNVGMGEITESNYVKFWTRYVAFWNAIDGSYDSLYFSLEDVRTMIGLKTNVFPMVTDAAFRKTLISKFEARIESRVRKDVEALEAQDSPEL